MSRQLASLFWVLLLMTSSAAARTNSSDYLKAPHWAPYRIVAIQSWAGLDYTQRNWNSSGFVVDMDGDGVDELVNSKANGTSLRIHVGLRTSPAWQEPLPIEFSNRDFLRSAEGVWHFDDPDQLEAVVKVQQPDGHLWYFERRRLSDGKFMGGFTLPGGPDNRANGMWDGNYRVIGVLDVPVDGHTVKAMIIGATAGWDIQPRGVFAVKADSGEVLWEYFVGPKPTAMFIFLVDLDGDGLQEIVFAGSAVDNIHGQTFNGTSDQIARVFALSSAGNLLWKRDFGHYPAGITLQPLVRSGQVPARFLVTTSNTTDDNAVILLDNRGEILDAVPVPQRLNQLLVWADDDAAPPLAVASLSDGTVYALEIEDDKLVRHAEVRMLGVPRIAGFMDLLPEPGPEILVGFHEGSTWVLNQDLKPLAYFDERPLPIFNFGLQRINGEGGVPYLVARGNDKVGGSRFNLEKNPRDIPWAGLVLVGAAGGLIPVWRRRRRRRDPSQATLRELKLQLLDRLKLSTHGAIGSLSTLRRFNWNLDALLQGFDVKAGERNIFGQLGQEILDVQLPNLTSALELAELAKLDKEKVSNAHGALDTLGGLLKNLDRQAFAPELLKAAGQELRAAGDDAERAFRHLRSLVEAAFRADTREIIQRALDAHADSLAASRVTVRADLADIPAVRMDQEEFAFVVENLIGNAVRAMSSGDRHLLVIEWNASHPDLTLTVSDTGCGIMPDDWQRIFEPGNSTREGGGLGLPRSRDLLRKYSGSIMVKDSQAAGGTTMAVILPLAGEQTVH